MDRDAIERRDFPVGRRGYDPAAVDAHLRAVADELESLRSRPAAPRLSAGTSEQVRVILEAAEASAAQLREDAGRRAGDHVGKVEDAAGGMLSRLDELENDLGGLLEALRQSGERLNEGLARLHEQVGALGGDEAREPDEPVVADEPIAADEPPAAAAPVSDARAATNGDEAGARLIALNMALGGTPREETARYLAEHYSLADPESLLADVYDRAGG